MQQTHRMKIFSKFTQNIKHLVNKHTLQQLHQKYYIRQFKIWEVDTQLAINLFLGIVTRTKKAMVQMNQFRWLQNQLRIFVWTLSFYSLSKNIDINQMTNQDWDFFTLLFPTKKKILFEYQATTLLKHHNQYKKWTHQEDQLFEQLVKKDNYRLRWSQLGKALFIESDKKYFRTSKQCRQRWLNHLDPSKLKKYWLQTQDFILIEHVKYFGKKWALISKKLENKRNQHSIKNRFKSLLTKQSKICQEPCPQEQLVDHIYCKLLKNVSKDRVQDNVKMNQQHYEPFPQHHLRIQDQKEDYHYHSHSHSQNHNHIDDIYEFDDSSISIGRKEKDILGDLSINASNSQENRHKKASQEHEHPSQIFEFTKLNCDLLNRKDEKKQKEGSNEMQKRIRADLFLQQDPFELLKSHFYRQSQ